MVPPVQVVVGGGESEIVSLGPLPKKSVVSVGEVMVG